MVMVIGGSSYGLLAVLLKMMVAVTLPVLSAASGVTCPVPLAAMVGWSFYSSMVMAEFALLHVKWHHKSLSR